MSNTAKLVETVITEYLIDDPDVVSELSGESERYMVRWIYEACLEQIDTEDTDFLAEIKAEVTRRRADIMSIVG